MRDVALACFALLRCRDRIGSILSEMPEARRREVEAAVKGFTALDERELRSRMAEALRAEEELERKVVERALGAEAWRAPRPLRRWIASRARAGR